MRLMASLKYGDAIHSQQLRQANANQVFNIFSLMEEREELGENYGDYRSFLFGRSPYCRILSGYIDKYVNKISTTPKTGPGPISYADFIALLQNAILKKGSVESVAEYRTFCPANQDVGYEFYQKIGSPPFSQIFLLESYGFPEGALHHSPTSIRTLLLLAEQQDEFERARGLIPPQPPHHTEKIYDQEIAYLSGEKLWALIQERGPRSIDLKSFYPEAILDMFEQAYSGEFAFYKRHNLTFDRP